MARPQSQIHMVPKVDLMQSGMEQFSTGNQKENMLGRQKLKMSATFLLLKRKKIRFRKAR